MVNLLDYSVNFAQPFMSQKKIDGGIALHYFSLEKECKQNQNEIYNAIKEVVNKILPRQRDKTALIIGTSLIDWNTVDAINAGAYEEKMPYQSRKRSIDSYAKDLAVEFGLNEFTMTIDTACTSSANALLEAKNILNAGFVEYVIAVGVEIFSPVMSSGFYSMGLLSPTKIRPFDTKRDGLVLGEGVGAMLLGKENAPWELLGGFSNCNSATITCVSEEGDECVEVMEKALKNCSLCPEDITAIKAHATGSLANDIAEMNALKKVFKHEPLITALKPYMGHTIGASGILEIAFLMSSIDKGVLPKTLNCTDSIGYKLIQEDKTCDRGIFMCNFFGFGGNNISLLLRKTI
jgi:3-oxoacyl-[acyl-carrier-protein] synthase-1